MFWPRNITTRTMFMVGSLMLLSYIISVVLIIAFLKQPVAKSTVIYLTRQVTAIHHGLLQMSPIQQKLYLRALVKRKQIKLQSAEPPNTPPGLAVNGAIPQYLTYLLGRNIEIRRQKVDNTHIAWVKLTVVNPNVWLGVWANSGKANFGLNFIIQLVVIIILSGIAVLFTTIRLVRPVKKLAAAALTLGQGLQPEPLAETGPREIQQLCIAFNKMAHDIHKLDEDRNILLAGISHDLRTPLARMRLAIELMGSKVEEELHSGLLQDMEDIDNIVGQFLSYARDGSEEALEETDIINLVNSVQDSFERQNPDKKIHTDLSGNNPKLTIRPISLKRMLNNLINNAFEYGKQPINITVNSDSTITTICVNDKGPGIPEEDIENLTRPFNRKVASRSNARHAGLGLAIVQRIANIHNAKLEISNRDQGGLRICIHLPNKC